MGDLNFGVLFGMDRLDGGGRTDGTDGRMGGGEYTSLRAACVRDVCFSDTSFLSFFFPRVWE